MLVSSYYIVSNCNKRAATRKGLTVPMLAAHGSTPAETVELFADWLRREHHTHMSMEICEQLLQLLNKVSYPENSMEVSALSWTDTWGIYHMFPITVQAN